MDITQSGFNEEDLCVWLYHLNKSFCCAHLFCNFYLMIEILPESYPGFKIWVTKKRNQELVYFIHKHYKGWAIKKIDIENVNTDGEYVIDADY